VSSAAPTAHDRIAVFRASHDRLTALVSGLDVAGLEAQSYDTDWSIGQVLSHLGSQSEIFGGILEAALTGAPIPGPESFQPVWDRWNAKSPEQWRDDLISSTEAEVARYEALDAATAEAFRISMFGMDLDLGGLLMMRIPEHSVHTWDVAVALDPAVTVAPDAVALIIDRLGQVAARGGKPQGAEFRVRVGTTEPQRDLVVTVGESVSIDPAEADDSYDGAVDLPAEAFVRLVYGRLDPGHTPDHAESGARGLVDLRAVFPGF
jgi:uncharacterized protein (TIGR03083 family)